jgi:hypothetical protein
MTHKVLVLMPHTTFLRLQNSCCYNALHVMLAAHPTNIQAPRHLSHIWSS